MEPSGEIPSSCVIYMHCIYCDEAIVTYCPIELFNVLVGERNAGSGIYIVATCCSECEIKPLYSINRSCCVRSAWVYLEIYRKYKVCPTVVLVNGIVKWVKIHSFVGRLTNRCHVRSIIYRSEELTEVEIKYSFCGKLPSECYDVNVIDND